MKTLDLNGAKLAQWVARANGFKVTRKINGPELLCWINGLPYSFDEHGYRPDLNWSQGAQIIVEKKIGMDPPAGARKEWEAHCQPDSNKHELQTAKGPTALVAVMRCFVASVYGENVPE